MPQKPRRRACADPARLRVCRSAAAGASDGVGRACAIAVQPAASFAAGRQGSGIPPAAARHRGLLRVAEAACSVCGHAGRRAWRSGHGPLPGALPVPPSTGRAVVGETAPAALPPPAPAARVLPPRPPSSFTAAPAARRCSARRGTYLRATASGPAPMAAGAARAGHRRHAGSRRGARAALSACWHRSPSTRPAAAARAG